MPLGSTDRSERWSSRAAASVCRARPARRRPSGSESRRHFRDPGCGTRAWSGRATAARSVTVGLTAPAFETHTLFTSTTVRARLTPAGGRFGLSAGAGPALVLHQGSGASLLARQADLGAVLSLAGTMSLDARLGFRLDAQEYLFSSTFRDSYAPPFTGALVQASGPQFRHEFVLLAGLSWLGF